MPNVSQPPAHIQPSLQETWDTETLQTPLLQGSKGVGTGAWRKSCAMQPTSTVPVPGRQSRTEAA